MRHTKNRKKRFLSLFLAFTMFTTVFVGVNPEDVFAHALQIQYISVPRTSSADVSDVTPPGATYLFTMPNITHNHNTPLSHTYPATMTNGGGGTEILVGTYLYKNDGTIDVITAKNPAQPITVTESYSNSSPTSFNRAIYSPDTNSNGVADAMEISYTVEVVDKHGNPTNHPAVLVPFGQTFDFSNRLVPPNPGNVLKSIEITSTNSYGVSLPLKTYPDPAVTSIDTTLSASYPLNVNGETVNTNSAVHSEIGFEKIYGTDTHIKLTYDNDWNSNNRPDSLETSVNGDYVNMATGTSFGNAPTTWYQVPGNINESLSPQNGMAVYEVTVEDIGTSLTVAHLGGAAAPGTSYPINSVTIPNTVVGDRYYMRVLYDTDSNINGIPDSKEAGVTVSYKNKDGTTTGLPTPPLPNPASVPTATINKSISPFVPSSTDNKALYEVKVDTTTTRGGAAAPLSAFPLNPDTAIIPTILSAGHNVEFIYDEDVDNNEIPDSKSPMLRIEYINTDGTTTGLPANPTPTLEAVGTSVTANAASPIPVDKCVYEIKLDGVTQAGGAGALITDFPLNPTSVTIPSFAATGHDVEFVYEVDIDDDGTPDSLERPVTVNYVDINNASLGTPPDPAPVNHAIGSSQTIPAPAVANKVLFAIKVDGTIVDGGPTENPHNYPLSPASATIPSVSSSGNNVTFVYDVDTNVNLIPDSLEADVTVTYENEDGTTTGLPTPPLPNPARYPIGDTNTPISPFVPSSTDNKALYEVKVDGTTTRGGASALLSAFPLNPDTAIIPTILASGDSVEFIYAEDSDDNEIPDKKEPWLAIKYINSDGTTTGLPANPAPTKHTAGTSVTANAASPTPVDKCVYEIKLDGVTQAGGAGAPVTDFPLNPTSVTIPSFAAAGHEVEYVYAVDNDDDGIPDSLERPVTVNYVDINNASLGTPPDPTPVNHAIGSTQTVNAPAVPNKVLFAIKVDGAIVDGGPTENPANYPLNPAAATIASVSPSGNNVTFVYDVDTNINLIPDSLEAGVDVNYANKDGSTFTEVPDPARVLYTIGSSQTFTAPNLTPAKVLYEVKVDSATIDGGASAIASDYPLNPQAATINPVASAGHVVEFIYDVDTNINGIPDSLEAGVDVNYANKDGSTFTEVPDPARVLYTTGSSQTFTAPNLTPAKVLYEVKVDSATIDGGASAVVSDYPLNPQAATINPVASAGHVVEFIYDVDTNINGIPDSKEASLSVSYLDMNNNPLLSPLPPATQLCVPGQTKVATAPAVPTMALFEIKVNGATVDGGASEPPSGFPLNHTTNVTISNSGDLVEFVYDTDTNVNLIPDSKEGRAIVNWIGVGVDLTQTTLNTTTLTGIDSTAGTVAENSFAVPTGWIFDANSTPSPANFNYSLTTPPTINFYYDEDADGNGIPDKNEQLIINVWQSLNGGTATLEDQIRVPLNGNAMVYPPINNGFKVDSYSIDNGALFTSNVGNVPFENVTADHDIVFNYSTYNLDTNIVDVCTSIDGGATTTTHGSLKTTSPGSLDIYAPIVPHYIVTQYTVNGGPVQTIPSNNMVTVNNIVSFTSVVFLYEPDPNDDYTITEKYIDDNNNPIPGYADVTTQHSFFDPPFVSTAPTIPNWILESASRDNVPFTGNTTSFTVTDDSTVKYVYTADENGNGIPDKNETFSIDVLTTNDNGATISLSNTLSARYGENKAVPIPSINGYHPTGYIIDGGSLVPLARANVVIPDVDQDSSVLFYYDKDSQVPPPLNPDPDPDPDPNIGNPGGSGNPDPVEPTTTIIAPTPTGPSINPILIETTDNVVPLGIVDEKATIETDNEVPLGATEFGEIEMFMKTPDRVNVFVGEYVDYKFTGIGNPYPDDVSEYCIGDIPPEGLTFVSGKIPAFTNGEGVTYDIVYTTNLQDETILAEGLDATQPYSFEAPYLQDGEYITEIIVKFGDVPAGFAKGDMIVYNFKVDDNIAPGTTLVNDGYISLRVDNQETYISNNGFGGIYVQYPNGDGTITDKANPKTGDDIMMFSAIAITAVVIGGILLISNRRKRTINE